MYLLKKTFYPMLLLTAMVLFVQPALQAQQRGGGRPAGAKPASKPAAKPAGQSAARPSQTQRPAPQAQKSNAQNRGNGNLGNDLNGGNRQQGGNNKNLNNKSGNNTNISGNKVNVDKSRGDVNINVDNSKNIKVNNTRNTAVVRNNYRPYTRPPYVYGGFHYRCYYPYVYHPYRPFYWGPVWHPWGFFVATLTATAIIVSFADADLPPVVHPSEYFVMQTSLALDPGAAMRSGPSITDGSMLQDYGPLPAETISMEEYAGLHAEAAVRASKETMAGEEYYYDQGVFYLKGDGGYTVVAGPVGGIVKSIPDGYETVVLDEAKGVKNYYWGGTFYEKVSKGYKVVAPTSGAVVQNLADGGEEVELGDVKYVKIGETYYQPIEQNGKKMYEVVDVEAAK